MLPPGDHWLLRDFYPRSPCGERLADLRPAQCPALYFYPRSPCGERQALVIVDDQRLKISIHALLAESDAQTLPHTSARIAISIHALLAESDVLVDVV